MSAWTRIAHTTLVASLLPVFVCACAHAASEDAASTEAIVQTMELKADAAAVRDRCFLYTELLQRLAETEGAQVDAGDEEHAASTLAHMERIAEKMKAAESKDSRRLKNAEELMHRTTLRLHDMLHLASGEERTAMNSTLDHLNHLHDEMLTLVFAQ